MLHMWLLKKRKEKKKEKCKSDTENTDSKREGVFMDKANVKIILANPDFLFPAPEVTTILVLLHIVNLIIYGIILCLFSSPS